jgi:hypothetical protein
VRLIISVAVKHLASHVLDGLDARGDLASALWPLPMADGDLHDGAPSDGTQISVLLKAAN